MEASIKVRWTPHEVTKMRLAFKEGATVQEVARTLRRGMSSVETKIRELAGCKTKEAIAAWASGMSKEEIQAIRPDPAIVAEPKHKPRTIPLYGEKVLRSRPVPFRVATETGIREVVISMPVNSFYQAGA